MVWYNPKTWFKKSTPSYVKTEANNAKLANEIYTQQQSSSPTTTKSTTTSSSSRTHHYSGGGGGSYHYSGGGGSTIRISHLPKSTLQLANETYKMQQEKSLAPPSVAAPKPSPASTVSQLLTQPKNSYNQFNSQSGMHKNVSSQNQIGNASTRNLARETYRTQQIRAAEQKANQVQYNQKVKTMQNAIQGEIEYYQTMYNQGRISYERANKSLQNAVKVLTSSTNKSIKQIGKRRPVAGIASLESGSVIPTMPSTGGLILKRSEAKRMGIRVSPYAAYAVVPSNKIGPQTFAGKAKALWQGSQKMVSEKIPTIQKVAAPISGAIVRGISKSKSGWTPKKLKTLKKVEKTIRPVGQVGAQVYTSAREKPMNIAATTAAYSLGGAIIGGIVKGATAVGEAVPFVKPVIKTAGYGVKAGVPLLYGSSVYERVNAASNPELAWSKYQKEIKKKGVPKSQVKLTKKQFYEQYNKMAISKGAEVGKIIATEVVPMIAGGTAGEKLSSKLFPKEPKIPRKEWKALQKAKPNVFIGSEKSANNYAYLVTRKSPKLQAVSIQRFKVLPKTGQIVGGKGTQKVFDLITGKEVSPPEPFTFFGNINKNAKLVEKKLKIVKGKLPSVSAGHLKILTNKNKLIKIPFAGISKPASEIKKPFRIINPSQEGSSIIVSGEIPKGYYPKTGKTGMIITPTGPLKYPIHENFIRARFNPTGFGIFKGIPEKSTIKIKMIKSSKVPNVNPNVPATLPKVPKVSKIPFAENLVKNLGRAGSAGEKNPTKINLNFEGKAGQKYKIVNIPKSSYPSKEQMASAALKIEQVTKGLPNVKLKPLIPSTVGVSGFGIKGVQSVPTSSFMQAPVSSFTQVPVSSFKTVSHLHKPVNLFPSVKSVSAILVKKKGVGNVVIRRVPIKKRISPQVKAFKQSLTQSQKSAAKTAFIQKVEQIQKSKKAHDKILVNKLIPAQAMVQRHLFLLSHVPEAKLKVKEKAVPMNTSLPSPFPTPFKKLPVTLGVQVNLVKGKSFIKPPIIPKSKVGYTFEIKRRGKWQRANVPFAFATKQGAEALAQKRVLASAAASYKIVKAQPGRRVIASRRRINPYRNVLFRKGKQPGVMVQKKRLRILSSGEKKEISYAGGLAKMAKARPKFLVGPSPNYNQLNLKGGNTNMARKRKVGRPKKRKSSRKKRR